MRESSGEIWRTLFFVQERKKGEMRNEISADPKYLVIRNMKVRVGTLRAASALFTVVGRCVQRPNGVVSVIMRTQHAASLHAYMPIYQYTNTPSPCCTLTCLNPNRSFDCYVLMKLSFCHLFFTSLLQCPHCALKV